MEIYTKIKIETIEDYETQEEYEQYASKLFYIPESHLSYIFFLNGENRGFINANFKDNASFKKTMRLANNDEIEFYLSRLKDFIASGKGLIQIY